MVKPGWKTTEFWITLVVTVVLPALVLFEVVTPEQAEQVGSAVEGVILAIADLVAVLAPLLGLIAYTWSRTRVKVAVNGKK